MEFILLSSVVLFIFLDSIDKGRKLEKLQKDIDFLKRNNKKTYREMLVDKKGNIRYKK